MDPLIEPSIWVVGFKGQARQRWIITGDDGAFDKTEISELNSARSAWANGHVSIYWNTCASALTERCGILLAVDDERVSIAIDACGACNRKISNGYS